MNAPQTADGKLAWTAIRRLGGQVRVVPETIGRFGMQRTFSHAYGLDFAAVIAFAERLGAANALFLELLPEIEGIVVRSYLRDEGALL